MKLRTGRSANFNLLETTSDPATWNIQVQQKTTESDHKKREKYAGQATWDWLEAWGKTPGTFPPRNNNQPPGIKIGDLDTS